MVLYDDKVLTFPKNSLTLALRAFSSAGLEHYLDRVGVTGSNPVMPTFSDHLLSKAAGIAMLYFFLRCFATSARVLTTCIGEGGFPNQENHLNHHVKPHRSLGDIKAKDFFSYLLFHPFSPFSRMNPRITAEELLIFAIEHDNRFSIFWQTSAQSHEKTPDAYRYSA
jgi:hypothetical protein